MDTIDQQFDPDDRLDTQRAELGESINEIANDIGMALRDHGIFFPVYITVRTTGDSLATIATPADPSEADWDRASGIVCQVISEKIGCGRLRGRHLACAVANGSMIAADVSGE